MDVFNDILLNEIEFLKSYAIMIFSKSHSLCVNVLFRNNANSISSENKFHHLGSFFSFGFFVNRVSLSDFYYKTPW